MLFYKMTMIPLKSISKKCHLTKTSWFNLKESISSYDYEYKNHSFKNWGKQCNCQKTSCMVNIQVKTKMYNNCVNDSEMGWRKNTSFVHS